MKGRASGSTSQGGVCADPVRLSSTSGGPQGVTTALIRTIRRSVGARLHQTSTGKSPYGCTGSREVPGTSGTAQLASRFTGAGDVLRRRLHHVQGLDLTSTW